jgi:hypothetical protein
MQTDGLGQVIAHPPAGLDMGFRRRLDPFARQAQPIPHRFGIHIAFMVCAPIGLATRRGVTLQRPPQPKHRGPLPLQASASAWVADIEFQADHRHRPLVVEIRGLGLTTPPRHHRVRGRGVGARGGHGPRKPSTTDIDPLPHR